jgi:hypothetical protein
MIVLGDTIIDVDWKKFIGLKTSALGVKKVTIPGNLALLNLMLKETLFM